MKLFGAFVGFAAAQTGTDWYTDWFNTNYNWADLVDYYYSSGL